MNLSGTAFFHCPYNDTAIHIIDNGFSFTYILSIKYKNKKEIDYYEKKFLRIHDLISFLKKKKKEDWKIIIEWLKAIKKIIEINGNIITTRK